MPDFWLICTEFNFGWGYTPDPNEGAYSAPRPDPPSWCGGGWLPPPETPPRLGLFVRGPRYPAYFRTLVVEPLTCLFSVPVNPLWGYFCIASAMVKFLLKIPGSASWSGSKEFLLVTHRSHKKISAKFVDDFLSYRGDRQK